MATERNYRIGGIRWPARPPESGSPPPGGGRPRVPIWAWIAGLLVLAVLVPAAVQRFPRGQRAPQQQAQAPAPEEIPVVNVETLPDERQGSGEETRSEPEQPDEVTPPAAPATTRRRDAEEPRAERRASRSTRRSEPERAEAPAPAVRREEPRRTASRPEPRAQQRGEATRRTSRTARTTPTRRRGESAAALNARAYRLQKQGRHSEAEPLLRRAVEIDPNHAYAQYNLGDSLVNQGKASQALKPLETTARQQPRRWEPQQRLGDAYKALGQEEKAAEAYARARELRGGKRTSARPAQARPVSSTARTRAASSETEPRVPTATQKNRSRRSTAKKSKERKKELAKEAVEEETPPRHTLSDPDVSRGEEVPLGGPTYVDKDSVLRPLPPTERVHPDDE